MGDLNQVNLYQETVPTCTSSPTTMHWYAAYTCAQHEKSVARQLQVRTIECFLPLYEKLSRWKDRRMKVQLPLFAGYVFVRLSSQDKFRALQVPGMVRLVGFGGYPTPLPDDEIQALRDGLSASLGAEPCPYVQIGRRVRVKSGALAGLEGTVLKKKSGLRFVVSLHLIQRSIAVEMDEGDLGPI
jgi:transcription antitermination factor NusG